MDTPAKNAWKKAYLSTVGTSSPKTPGKESSVLYVSRRLSCAFQGFEIIQFSGAFSSKAGIKIFVLPGKQNGRDIALQLAVELAKLPPDEAGEIPLHCFLILHRAVRKVTCKALFDSFRSTNDKTVLMIYVFAKLPLGFSQRQLH